MKKKWRKSWYNYFNHEICELVFETLCLRVFTCIALRSEMP